MSEPTRYRVANNQAQLTLGGGILAVDPAGPLVMYEDYAKLRMERIHDLNQIGGLQEDNARLTAELAKCEEHNEALCERMQDLNSEVFTASCTNARLHSLFANSELENARLKAEVENSKRINTELLVLSNRQASDIRRLRKAGDELANTIQFNEEMEKDYDGETIVHPSVERWNEAKEGKQS